MKLPEEKIKQIREAVKAGKSRYTVATNLGADIGTVYKYTDDLPKIKNKPISDKIKRKIRSDMKAGLLSIDISKKYGVSTTSVHFITKDIPKLKGNSGIRGSTLDVMKELLEKGYIITSQKMLASSYRTMRKYFSDNIRKVCIGGRVIYFLKGKEKEAFRAFMKKNRYKVVKYGRMCEMMRPFGIKMSPKEKREMLSG